MPQTIEVPDVGLVDFPDGMSDDEIVLAIRSDRESSINEAESFVRNRATDELNRTAQAPGNRFVPQVASAFAPVLEQPNFSDVVDPNRGALPDMQATTRGGPPLSVPEGAMRSTLGEIGNAIGDLREVPGKILTGLEQGAAAALNIPEAMYREATGITPKEMVITPESITQRDQPLHFQAGKPVVNLGAESAMQPEGNPVSRLIEGFITPGNIAAFPFASSKVVQALFLSQMAPAAIEAATKFVDPNLSRPERQDAATELLISGLMTYGIGKHLLDTPAKALARQIGGTEFEPRPETAPTPIVETGDPN